MTFKDIIESKTLNLGNVYRYSGFYLINKESVADHMVQVFYIGLGIAEELSEEGINFRRDAYALKVLVHDLEEAALCDIPRPVKYHSETLRKELEYLAKDTIAEFSNEFPNAKLPFIWHFCKDQSVEGRVLRLADTLQVIRKVHEEIALLNNYHMIPVAKKTQGYLVNKKEYFATHPEINLAEKQVYVKFINEAIDYVTEMLEGIRL